LRNKAINAALCHQFSQRAIKRFTRLLLCGHVDNNEGVIDAPIAKDPALFPLMSICAINGKPARSRYRVVERMFQEQGRNGVTVDARAAYPGDRANPSTIHCQQLGHPIIGCDLYGGLEWPGTEQTPRLMLHASGLDFVHPVSGKAINARHDAPF
jgi:tRNA pseudouridine32 synthase/23S rRNA pseudouridine746 synthase